MAETTRRLGRYELRHRIAKGGMGEIYLAKMHGAAGFEKNVIIKTILPHLAEEEEFITKFLDEGRIVVQLLHGNIVPVFDMGEEDGEYFIAMEYIPGRDLREVVKRLQVRGESMPMDLALYIASEAAKGLDYAHRKTSESGESLGIVHRDISPSNLLISSEGEVKIIDFGIARAAGRLSKTVSGRIQGKFCYMSPEQASGKELDARSDVFSLGTTLYEMLTGFRPFEGRSDLESLDLVRTCEFDPPSTLNPEIGPEVDAILAKALSLDQSERYASAEKLQVDILQYLYSTGSSPTGSDIARFLNELFPDGLERTELKKARGSSSNRSGSANAKMSLDDAMDALLGESGNPVDPHETTAASDRLLKAGHTSTLAAQVHTPTTVEEPTPSHPSVPSAVAPAQGRKRWTAVWVLLGVLIGASVMVYMFTRPNTGKLTINSDPAGARIHIDGILKVGALTPHTFELDEGAHRVRLELEGFQDQRLEIDVDPGETAQVSSQDAQFVGKEEPREFLVTAPDGAAIWRDGQKAGVGAANITVSPGGLATLEARKEGCTGQIYPLSYEHKAESVQLPLTCESAPAAVPEVEPEVKKEDVERMVRVRVVSKPPGAEVEINGKAMGAAPVVANYPARDWLTIRATLEGHEPRQVKHRAAYFRGTASLELKKLEMGCLTLSLGDPQIGEVSIDGGAYENISRGFKARPLAAGKHTIRARNNVAEKEDTVVIEVASGSNCKVVHIWPAH